MSCAGGATGILYPRWRPLLDGPLFGAYGAFGMDGSVTPRAEMAGKVAKWANSNPDIWKSRPIKGEIGIVFVHESELFNYVQRGSTQYYAESARGAYQGFFDSNIQADFVHLDHIDEYPVVYLLYPVMLKEATARKLMAYVEKGGQLISEGTPGYFGDRGKVGTVQPNLGLDTLFGARESYVEFTPDLLDDLTLRVHGFRIGGRLFRQEFTLAGGTAVGRYENGKIAAIENRHGKGKALLIGTFPGAGYYLRHLPESKAFFAWLLEWAGAKRRVCVDNTDLKARVHAGAGGSYLWVVNPKRTPRSAIVTLAPTLGIFRTARDLWQQRTHTVSGDQVHVHVDDRDVAVIRLE
jgi:beta-galactosidase